MTTQIYAGVREILTAPDWDAVYVTDHGPFVTIAGRFNGRAHAGSRDDWKSLAEDMDRIAREQYAHLLAEAEEIADEPVEEAAPEPVIIPAEQYNAVLEDIAEALAEPEPNPNADLLHQLDALKDLLAERDAEIERLRAIADTPLPPADAKLSDHGEVGEESLTTADLTEDVIQRLTKAKRKKFTELLNVELAELQQERGGPREDLKRENEIEALLGLFARVGEM